MFIQVTGVPRFQEALNLGFEGGFFRCILGGPMEFGLDILYKFFKRSYKIITSAQKLLYRLRKSKVTKFNNNSNNFHETITIGWTYT